MGEATTNFHINISFLQLSFTANLWYDGAAIV